MIEWLRNNERIRDTFGRYIDPRVAQDLLDETPSGGHPGPAASDDCDVLRHDLVLVFVGRGNMIRELETVDSQSSAVSTSHAVPSGPATGR
jgi:hypothetical protein